MSTIGELMREELKQVTAVTSVREAAKRMRDEQVGSLVVEKEGCLIGIVTDTDIVRRAVAQNSDLGTTSVESIMSRPIAGTESMPTVQDALGSLKRYAEPRITQD